jgi:hypothetical protein
MKRSEAVDIIFSTIKDEADKAHFKNRDKMWIYGGYDGEVFVDKTLAFLVLQALEKKGLFVDKDEDYNGNMG